MGMGIWEWDGVGMYVDGKGNVVYYPIVKLKIPANFFLPVALFQRIVYHFGLL